MSSPEEQLQTLQVITDVLGWISFVCNILIFIGYTLNAKARQFPSSIFWYSLIPAIIQSLSAPFGTLAGYPARSGVSPLCTIQGMIVHYGSLSWSTWVLLSTIHLYLLIVKSRVFSNPQRTESLYLVIGFVFPFLPVLVSLIAQVYAPAGIWCFISGEANGFWILFTTYFWIGLLCLAALIITSIVVAHVQINLYKLKKASQQTQEYRHTISSISSFQKRLITFIALFCGIFLLATIVRVRQIIIFNLGGPASLDYEWSMVLTLAFGLTGIIHLLSFATNKALYQQAYKTCTKGRPKRDPCCI
jgi:hypothetical protein